MITIVGCISDKINNSQQITADLINPENPPIIKFQDEIFDFAPRMKFLILSRGRNSGF